MHSGGGRRGALRPLALLGLLGSLSAVCESEHDFSWRLEAGQSLAQERGGS